MTAEPVVPPAAQARAEEAERLARAGRHEAAAALYREVLTVVPDHARALNFLAMRALAEGDLAAAQDWIDRAAAGSPRLALVEANRATILYARGEREAALQALLAALELDPEFAPARLDAGLLLDELGRPRDAADHLRRVLAQLPPPQAQPPALRERTARAEQILAREQRELDALIAARLAPLRARHGAEERARFDECLDIFAGRKRPQLPKPGFMHFPKLAPLTFFPRELFDWLPRLERETETIRNELLAVLRSDEAGFIPYVQKAPEDSPPGSVWQPLNYRNDWGAYFLFNHGKRVEKHCAACPATAALLEELPLVRIPGRAPTAFFSRLRPGTRIPPHHGATNTRVIVHLPLIVPPDCGIRVGNDVRQWVPGQALVFDDTIEHEAWNLSDRERVVLIFDAWNPFLTPVERELITEMTAALAEFYPGELHKTDF